MHLKINPAHKKHVVQGTCNVSPDSTAATQKQSDDNSSHYMMFPRFMILTDSPSCCKSGMLCTLSEAEAPDIRHEMLTQVWLHHLYSVYRIKIL